MPPPKTKKELQAFLGIINYLGKFSPSTAELCGSLRKLTSAKNRMDMECNLQKTFDKAKEIIKEDACMKFYDETRPLYIATDASGVGLGAALLQTRGITSCHRDKVLGNCICQQEPHWGRRDTTILKEKHWVYSMSLKNSIIIALQER